VPNYTLLRRGDNLPTVGVLQLLLNRTGAQLRVDGQFGYRTQAAVADFQRDRHLAADGVVGEDTWARLSAVDRLPILDCIDVFDAALYEGDAAEVRRAGGDPILIGGMSRGVGMAAAAIIARGPDVFLLRFIGHGTRGWQGISAGKGGFGDQRSAIHYVNAPNIQPLGIQRALGPYGNIEMHGCHVAAGARGRQFITTLAHQFGVPVTAGTATQYSTFRFDGPTFTALPGGHTLHTWCASLPAFPLMTVP
jgi:hypothetical protein